MLDNPFEADMPAFFKTRRRERAYSPTDLVDRRERYCGSDACLANRKRRQSD